MRNWIEEELRRQMSPVRAPESLSGRVFPKKQTHLRRSYGWVVWPALAATVLLVSSEVRYHAEKPTVTRSQARTLSIKGDRAACLQCHTDRL